MQAALFEHSAILSILLKQPFAIKTFALSFLSGRLRQVLLYYQMGKKVHINGRAQRHSKNPDLSSRLTLITILPVTFHKILKLNCSND